MFCFILSGTVYVGSVLHYCFHHRFIVPFLGGWISGLLLMEGLARRPYVKS